MNGDQAARLFLDSLEPGSLILDIGGGDENGKFAKMAMEEGHECHIFDWSQGQDWEMPHLPKNMINKYDGVVMSHVLEHLLNVHFSLERVSLVLKDNGLFSVTVPPLKNSIVGGHVSLWNAGLLLYRLILAGFDCSDAAVKTYGYNCSVVVRKRLIEKMPDLSRDYGDIQALSHFFPAHVTHGFDGRIEEHRWRKL